MVRSKSEFWPFDNRRVGWEQADSDILRSNGPGSQNVSLEKKIGL